MTSPRSDESKPGLHYKTGSLSISRTPAGDAAGVQACIRRCHELLSDRGEVPGARLADDVIAIYTSLDVPSRQAVVDRWASDFAAGPSAVARAAEEYIENLSDTALTSLQRADDAPRQELFLRLHAAHDGTPFLVGLRQDLLRGLADHASWAAVEADLARVLKALFNRGLLEFRRIDASTPTPVLEKLIQYEAVHEIRDRQDLRRRLDSDRRCYAFFHPAWPDEPLIFTELTLTRGMSAKIQPMLDPNDPVVDAGSCDCAIFYSISNCQQGLRGFAFGNALIGRVVEELRGQLPRLRTFATLSPIPGFRPWLSALAGSLDGVPGVAALVAKLDASQWLEDAATAGVLEAELMPLCALYLLHAKHGSEPADPVARFHLANGARLQRVNWLSDVSPAGLRRSAGLTANYVYHPTNLRRNIHTYATAHKVNSTRYLERLSTDGRVICARQEPPTVLQISA